MNSATTSAAIVGAHFHPPARTLLEVLPIGCPLILRREPHNPHDANAIAIFLEGRNVPEVDGLDEALLGWGTSVAAEKARDEIDLGYIPRDHAADLVHAGFPLGDVDGSFSVSAGGAPRVRFQSPGGR